MALDSKHLDKSVPIPLYYQLKSILLDEIKSGTYSVGASIPAENQIRKIFNISRTTVRQAVNELIQEGWLYRESTIGTFVTTPKKKSTLIRSSEPFNQQILRTGQVPRTEVMETKIIVATNPLAQVLEIEEGSEIISLFRRRFADDVPVVTMQNYLPLDKCDFVLDHNYVLESLYEVLSTNPETKVTSVNRKVEAVAATPHDVELLDVKALSPILSFISVARNKNGCIIEHSIMRYRGDCSAFDVNVSEDNE